MLLAWMKEVKQPVSRPNHRTMAEGGTPFDFAAVVPSMELGRAAYSDEVAAVVAAVSTTGIPGSPDRTEVVVGHYCYIQIEELDHIEVEAVDILQDSQHVVQVAVGASVVERQHRTMVPESSHSFVLVQVFVKERQHSWIGSLASMSSQKAECHLVDLELHRKLLGSQEEGSVAAGSYCTLPDWRLYWVFGSWEL